MNTCRKLNMRDMTNIVRYLRLNGMSAFTNDGECIRGNKIVLIRYFSSDQEIGTQVDFTYVTFEENESYCIELRAGMVIAKKIADDLLTTIRTNTLVKVSTLFENS